MSARSLDNGRETMQLLLSLIVALVLIASVPAQSKRRGPKPRATPTPTPTPTPVATPTPTPTPVATPQPTPSPSPSLFRVDEFGQATATNYDTWSGTGSYRVGGQTILRWDSVLSNFIGGKVATNPVFNGQQNFLVGNMVVCCPSGTANTSFGWDAGRPTSGSNNTFFGHDAGLGISTGSFNTFVGQGASVPQNGTLQVDNSIALGAQTQITASNQFVVGGSANSLGVDNAYLGQGVFGFEGVQPKGITIQATGARGTNVTGGPLTIAGGKSTGSATPASIFFSTSSRTLSGTGPQTLVKRWEIDGEGNLKSVGGGRVEANLKLGSGLKPPCTADTEAQFWFTKGGEGQGSFLELCTKTASGLYVYRMVLFPQ